MNDSAEKPFPFLRTRLRCFVVVDIRSRVRKNGVASSEGFEYKHTTQTRSFLPVELFVGPVLVSGTAR